MKARYAILAIAAMFVAVNANAVDLHGYFRQAEGVSSKGGDQVTFKNKDQDYKLRLGNEDNWSEFEYVQLIQKDKNGVEWTAGFMLGWGNGFNGDGDFASVNALQQEYIRATFPQLGGATVWGGKRFYHRHANDIFDYFYMNESGPGVGIEDIDVGFGKLSAALFRFNPDISSKKDPAVADDPATPYINESLNNQNDNGKEGSGMVFLMPDFRLEGIPVNPGGTLNIALLSKIRMWNKERNGQADAPDGTSSFGVHAMVKHSQGGILNGGNNFAIDFKNTCFIDSNCPEKRWKLTATEDLLLQPTKAFAINFAAIYTYDKQADGKTNLQGLGVGVRPFFKFTDHFGLGGDAGYFYTKSSASGSKADSMFKLTVAPTITPFTDGFAWGVRPEIRFYATYASWNKEQNFNDKGDKVGFGGGAFKNDATSGVTLGTQVETWF